MVTTPQTRRPGLSLPLVLILVGLPLFSETSHATRQLPPRGPQLERPALRIAPTETPPLVDGVFDDACWEGAVTARPFNLSYQARYSPYRAEARLTYDATNFYVCIRSFDPDPETYPWLPWPPDRDASVAEVLLAAGLEETFYKVAVNSEGKVFVTQPMANALPWKEAVAAAMQHSEGVWTAEFAIPFTATDLPSPQPTAAWRVNLGWRTPKCVAYSAWAVTHAWFYEPQYYGDLFFGGSGTLTAKLAKVEEPRPGRNALPLVLSNGGAGERECEVLVTMEAAAGVRVAFQEVVSVPAGGPIEVPAGYNLGDGATGVATVAVYEKGEAQPFFRQSIPVEIPPHRRTYREIRSALACLPPLAKKLEEEKADIEAELNACEDAVSQDPVDVRKWKDSARPLERLLGRARKLLWISNHSEELADRSFAVGLETTLHKILRDRAYEGELADVVSLSAARGEREGAQLLVVPLGKDLNDLEVHLSDLTGPAGAVIPKNAIEVFWTDFVETRTPRYPIEYVGWFADPLLPWEACPRFVPENALHQPLWVTVAVPGGIPAGVYMGSLEIRAGVSESWPVRLRVRVYDFDLPIRPALQTSMWLNESHIKDWYGWKEIPHAIHRKQMEFLLQHRVNPTWFGPIGTDEDIEFQLERGLNLVMLGVASHWPLDQETEEKIGRYYSLFKERDLLDMTFVYGQDEPSPGDYPKVRDTLDRVAKAFPGVRRVCTAYPPVPMLEGAVDTWVVGPNLFNYGPVAARVAAGDELWIYLSASVRRPYVTQLYLDYTALENRLIGWYCWKYGATGFLYWGINEWRSNNQPWSGRPEIDDAIREGKRWPEVPWNTWTYLNCNGDAQYIYPGTDAEFWSSVRFEIIRDSFEDYDYLALLDQARQKLAGENLPQSESLLTEAEELLAIGPPLASDLATASEDPMDLLSRRERIAEHLERILARFEGK